MLNSPLHSQSFLPVHHISARPVAAGAVVCHAGYIFSQTALFSNVYTTLRKENIYLDLAYSAET